MPLTPNAMLFETPVTFTPRALESVLPFALMAADGEGIKTPYFNLVLRWVLLRGLDNPEPTLLAFKRLSLRRSSKSLFLVARMTVEKAATCVVPTEIRARKPSRILRSATTIAVPYEMKTGSES